MPDAVRGKVRGRNPGQGTKQKALALLVRAVDPTSRVPATMGGWGRFVVLGVPLSSVTALRVGLGCSGVTDVTALSGDRGVAAAGPGARRVARHVPPRPHAQVGPRHHEGARPTVMVGRAPS